MKSKLLIVTAFYNENERLRFTLENMLRQRSSDFVHLLIDDGSRDDSSDSIVKEYLSQSKAQVIFEKHENAGINEVHMRAFQRTEELGCTHFMWLDCGDGLAENAVNTINQRIEAAPEVWWHLDGYYVSDASDEKRRMSKRSYLPYLRKRDQLLPFCFSISTYGHFIIPFRVYAQYNPGFELTKGFYYDAQIIGALSLNSCPHGFVRAPLSIIQDDMHYSVANASGQSYSDNVMMLARFVVSDPDRRARIAELSSGMKLISVRSLLGGRFSENRKKIKALKDFYKSNQIRITDRYKWFPLLLIAACHFC